MPWLIQSTPSNPSLPLSSHLFFVHVPRCGGTSLMQHFSIPQKVAEARGPFKRLAMKYFFMRYKTLESANFPVKTRENLACLGLLGAAAIARSTVLAGVSVAISLFTTLICTAPVIGRITPVHRWYLWFVHYPMLRSLESIDWCTGTNKYGYIMHLTAPKLLGYGYVTPQQMDTMCSLAIVRNPYTRMVSIYGYNRFGEAESFPAFMRRWKKLMRHYIERGEKEEWYTPCHCLPQFEYTHFNGKQLVQSVVKQEELKLLKTTNGAEQAIRQDSSIGNLPDVVRNALLGMPHTNSRKTSRKWYDFFDQETLELTYQLYKYDFEVFGYDTAIKERPDLIPPKRDRRSALLGMKFDQFSRNSLIDMSTGNRLSKANLFESVKSTIKNDNRTRSSVLKSSLLSHNREDILAAMVGVYDHEVSREGIREASRESSMMSQESNGDSDGGDSGFEWSKTVLDAVDNKKDD